MHDIAYFILMLLVGCPLLGWFISRSAKGNDKQARRVEEETSPSYVKGYQAGANKAMLDIVNRQST
jgi:hypothetical protein